ncbi:MAG: hypothetical protein Q8O37_08240 [Sulfuricellaceae bacterium]|nr:hypothetical protein [Sulfuricellaceae bacterium]
MTAHHLMGEWIFLFNQLFYFVYFVCFVVEMRFLGSCQAELDYHCFSENHEGGIPMRFITRCVLPIFLPLFMTACGVDVATTAATQAQLKAKEVEEAKKTMDQFQQKLDTANQAQELAREAAEKSANP